MLTSASKTSKQLPWSYEQELVLLDLVISKGCHLIPPKSKGVTEAWEKLNTDLFLNCEFAGLKNDHYKEGGSRKIRDKYEALIEAIQKDVDTGNQSGKAGERSLLYERVKQIKDEIDNKDEDDQAEIEDTKNLKKKMDEAEANLTTTKKKPAGGWGKRKDLDGNIIGNDLSRGKISSSHNSSGFNRFEERLFNMVIPPNQSEANMKVDSMESTVEKLMLAWIETNGKNIASVISEAKLNDPKSYQQLEEISIEVLVNLYCTRGSNFKAECFKKALLDEGLPTISTHKIYILMQKWREASVVPTVNDAMMTPVAGPN